MNLHRNTSCLPGASGDDVSIRYNYMKGRDFQEKMNLQSQVFAYGDDDIEEKNYQIHVYRGLAIENYLKSLTCVGPTEEQCIKINALLSLVEICDQLSEKQSCITYFYSAVELARQQFGDRYAHTHYGDLILNSYIKYIDTTFVDIFKQEYYELFLPLIQIKILSESNSRIQAQLEKASSIVMSITSHDTSSDVILRLEDIFGPVRMIICSIDSGEILIAHNTTIESVFIEDAHSDMGCVSINVFDSLRKYQIRIDRGSVELANQFKVSHLEHIIYPILCIFIQKKEYEYFTYATDNTDTIEMYEANVAPVIEYYDYREVIRSIVVSSISPLTFHEAIEDTEIYIDECVRAIDICRAIRIFQRSNRNQLDIDHLSQEVDHHTGGKINRNILDRVKSILLTCSETMNGIGYPFGLTKKNTPLEGKIYAIIRAYEALCLMRKEKKAIETMIEWSQGGYFDTDLINIFIKNVNCGLQKKQIIVDSPVSGYRKNRYQKFIQLWQIILNQISDIENLYHDFRRAEGDKNRQNSVGKKVNEKYLELIRIADIKKILIISRHAEALSDSPGGPPGDDNELITPAGETSSYLKGNILSGLHCHIYSSPFVRARQTAAIICQKIRFCTQNIIPVDGVIQSCQNCPGITPQIAIGNPAKNMDNGRYNSCLQKFFVDNTNGMMEFLLGIICSPQYSTSLFIVHRDSGRHMIFWLKNLFSQKGVTYNKLPIENNSLYELFFRGNQLIESDFDPGKLLFSIFNWKEVLAKINQCSLDIYDIEFYIKGNVKTNLVALHNCLLDFIDQQNEIFPEKTSIFVENIQKFPELSIIGSSLGSEHISIM